MSGREAGDVEDGGEAFRLSLISRRVADGAVDVENSGSPTTTTREPGQAAARQGSWRQRRDGAREYLAGGGRSLGNQEPGPAGPAGGIHGV